MGAGTVFGAIALLLFSLAFTGILLFAALRTKNAESVFASLATPLFILISLIVICVLYLLTPTDSQWASDVIKVLVGVFVGTAITFSFVSNHTSLLGSGNQIGSGSKIAGRDINEVLNEIKGNVAEIKNAQVTNTASEQRSFDLWCFVAHMDEGDPINLISAFHRRVQSEGWVLRTVCQSWVSEQGLVAFFERPTDGVSRTYLGEDQTDITEG